MFCGKCGEENPSENKFCEKCGAELGLAEKSAGTKQQAQEKAAGSRKKLMIGGIAAVVIILVAIIALVAGGGGGSEPSAEYNEKIREADRYMEELEYEKAEAAYLEAIEIQPEIDEAYLKLADTYVVQEKYEEAVSILEQGQDAAGGEAIEKKLEAVRAYSYFYDYLQEVAIPEHGLATVDETFTWGSGGGLVSAMVEDLDGDNEPEMLTVSYGDTKHAAFTITTYEYEEGEVVPAGEYVEDDMKDGENIWTKYEFFLKEHEGKKYLTLWADEAVFLDALMQELIVYQIDGEIKRLCTATTYSSIEECIFLVDDEIVAEYTDPDAIMLDDASAQAAVDAAMTAFKEVLGKYGLVDNMVKTDYGMLNLLSCDEADETTESVLYIEQGDPDNISGAGMYENRDLRLLMDHTYFRDALK